MASAFQRLLHLSGYLERQCNLKRITSSVTFSAVLCNSGIAFQPYSTRSVYKTETSKQIINADENDILYRAIDILIKGHEKSVLSSFMMFMAASACNLDIDIAGQLTPKPMFDRITLLKSVHIFKKHRVQYEMRTHRQVLQLKFLTGSTANVYLEYIERNIPAGVAMHVHKWQLEQIPKHIQERMKENISFMTKEDWIQQYNFIDKMKNGRLSKNSDYEEYHTTKRYLLGTVM